MPYLNAVVMEILRLEPPVRSIPRLASQPVEIGGTRIAAGEEVLSLTRTIHLREDLWGDDAREFKPERWVQDLCGNGGAKQKNSFLPFSHGPRNCIGKEYALIQLKVMLLGLVGNFHFAPVGGTGPPRLSTPTPLNFMTYTRTVKGRLHLRVQRLEEWGNLTIA
jgi:cytochrome P450